MAKSAKAKNGGPYARLPGETTVEFALRIARAKGDTRDKSDRLVTKEAERHGDYRDDTLYSVNDSGQIVRDAVKRNRGGTPVARWDAAGKLTPPQINVINQCQRLWWIAGRTPRVTANYGERIAGGGDTDAAALAAAEARDDLARYQGHFPGPLGAYWSVFENVVRHAIPAGVAGAGAGYEGKAAEKRAHLCVCFVADIVAMHEGL